ncbi:MAG TPA: glycosyltransferase family 9 protein [Candidatus Nanoarchaeia archaeon]|nr:glycosyltransferase family 9 protein [Candidatus Nanoarchaeia archaeon]
MGERILLIKLAAMGDVLRTTFLLAALKEKYTGCSIDWVTEKNAVELLLGNPFIDNVFVIGDKLNLKYSKLINLDEDERACRLAGSLNGEVIGFYWDNGIKYTPTAKEWFDMSALGKKPENDILKRKNRKTYQQIMCEIAGVEWKHQKPILVLPPDAVEFGKKLSRKLEKGKLTVGLNTGAGGRWKLKKLSEEKTAGLADRLVEELDAQVVLFGGPEEKERNERIKKMISHKIVDAGCDNTLMEFAALVNLCDVLVTSDSLALHIGIALGKKIVVFFGPTSPWEIELYGNGVKVFKENPCLCCYKENGIAKPTCDEYIDVGMIVDAVRRVV